MKNTNKTYIAIASRNDRGPLEHINAILKNQNSTFSFISNLSESDLRITKYCNFFPTNKSKYIDIQLDILRILFKNNFKGSILVRHSVGFIIPYIYLLIKFKRPILELNGFTAQDLKDRKKSLFLKLINYITELFILHFSKNIIIVHKNLQALYSKRYFLNNKKFIVINNGISELNIDPIKKKNSDVVTLGYLGSLAAREGVDILLEHFSKLDKTKFKLLIIGGSPEEFEKLNYSNLNNIEYIENSPRLSALKMLNKTDICVHLRRPLKGKYDSQGMPLKMLDYLYLNKPVIASNIQSYQFIEENGFGELISPYNFKQFLTSIETLADKKISKDNFSKSFIEENFLWSTQITKLNSIWRDN